MTFCTSWAWLVQESFWEEGRQEGRTGQGVGMPAQGGVAALGWAIRLHPRLCPEATRPQFGPLASSGLVLLFRRSKYKEPYGEARARAPKGGSPEHPRYAGYGAGPPASSFQHNLGLHSECLQLILQG